MQTPMFYPGQKVTCVNDEFTILLAQDPRIQVPVLGDSYTVRKNFQFPHAVGVTLVELDNSHALPRGGKLEPNFDQNRFVMMLPAKVDVLEEELTIETSN